MMSQRSRVRRGAFYCLITTAAVWLILMAVNFPDKQGSEVPSHSPVGRDYVIFQEYEDLIEDTNKSGYLKDDSDENLTPVKLNLYKGYFISESNMTKHNCVVLKTLEGTTPICVHGREEDSIVSSRVRDFGTWEEDLLNATGSIIATHPKVEFLDLGCNIGVYTLFVAKMNRNVVSVDPLKENLALLYTSLRMGNLYKYVTLIQNCISDVYETVAVNVPVGNIGGAHVSGDRQNGGNRTLVDTILMDDLIPIFRNKELFIKMDIEGYELHALNGGHKFFQTINVKYILMEWVHHRRNDNGRQIIDFLVKNGLMPYKDVTGKDFLDPDSYYLWPENVFWIKR